MLEHARRRQGLLLLVDGIVQNSLNGAFELGGPAYSLFAVDRIEVIFGPASALYGANAFSGIINLISRAPGDSSTFDYRHLRGSFDSQRDDMFLATAPKAGIALSVVATRLRSDGPGLDRIIDGYTDGYVDDALGWNLRLQLAGDGRHSVLGLHGTDTSMGNGSFGNTPTAFLGLPPRSPDNPGTGGFYHAPLGGEPPGRWHPYTQTVYAEHRQDIDDRWQASARLSYRRNGLRDDSHSYSLNRDGSALTRCSYKKCATFRRGRRGPARAHHYASASCGNTPSAGGNVCRVMAGRGSGGLDGRGDPAALREPASARRVGADRANRARGLRLHAFGRRPYNGAPSPPASATDTMKVLVMRHKRVGDVLASGLLCENLRRHLPQAEMHFLAHQQTTAVLQGNPHIDCLHACPARSPVSRQWQLAGQLRRQRFDVVIDVYGKTESLLLVAGCRARRSIGYRKWYTRLVYSDPVQRVAQPVHGLPLAIEHRLQLLQPLLGALPIAQLATRPRLYIDARERDDARAFLAGHGIDDSRSILMIGALGSEPAKSYPLPAMATLLDRIAERCDSQLLFNCLPSQRDEVEVLYRLCAESTRARIVLQALPQGLRQFIAVLAECRALIGNEGGAVNMARALDVPTFSIFSPWISKQEWGFDHEPQHPSVHLADFAAQSFAGRSAAELKQRVDELYALFRPEWIEPALDRFLATLTETTPA